MLGAIVGDVIGSSYEWKRTKNYGFKLFTPRTKFTDDTVHTVALAKSYLTGESFLDLIKSLTIYYCPKECGTMFLKWMLRGDNKPYGSYGNGSAMRVSPAGWKAKTLEEALQFAKESAIITHDHPEGIKGAEVVAGVIFLAKTGHGKRRNKKMGSRSQWIRS